MSSQPIRVVTRLSRLALCRETVIVRGRRTLAVLADGHPFEELLACPYRELTLELRRNRRALARFLALYPHERETLTAVLKYRGVSLQRRPASRSEARARRREAPTAKRLTHRSARPPGRRLVGSTAR